jgi:protease-4
LTGSIGVFAMFPTFERSLEKLGVYSDGVGTTALSGEFRAERSLGEAGRDILQQSIEYEYRQFIGRVAKARDSTPEQIDSVAQGRVWSGEDAARLGLVDQLGRLEDAVELAAELAELGENYDLEYADAPLGLTEALGLRLQSRAAGMLAPLLPDLSGPRVPDGLEPLVREMRRLERLRDPHSIFAYCLACVVD